MSTITLARPPLKKVPPLQPGDTLSRAEFERRYDAMPNLKKAELIEGVVYMPPPPLWDDHGSPHFDMITWLGVYRIATPGTKGNDNTSIYLDLDNMPQPDIFLRILESHGGRCHVDAKGRIKGAPELIAEVAATSVSYDLHDKLKVYRRNGVKEYVVWRVFDRAIDYFILQDGKYERLAPTGRGILRSQVFPGLWLDPAALISGDVEKVHSVLQKGIAGREHNAFVSKLKRIAKSSKG